jgi:hypothetical protein
MLAPKRALQVSLAAILLLASSASSLAQTARPTGTATLVPQPEVEETEEAPLAPEDYVTAEVEAGGPLELTVYNQNLGLVRQVRAVQLSEGLNEVYTTDVASRIIPASVHVVPLESAEGLTLLEQQFDYDIVDSSTLLNRYVDQVITVIVADDQSLTGTLLSARDDLVLQTDFGIEIVRRDQIRQVSLPPTAPLRTRPTLTWLFESEEEGSQDLQITYLTSGISWQADYVALLTEDDTQMALESWISVNNQSGASYEDARLKLVAGQISRVATEQAFAEEAMFRAMDGLAAAAPPVEQRGFMDYHLYDVARRLTIRDQQTKQIEFLSAEEIAVEKQYVLEMTPPIFVRLGRAITDAGYGVQEQGDVSVQIHLANDEESGLGLPLPQGTVRIYKEDIDGSPLLVGETTIAHTPRNESLRLTVGQAFDLVSERTQTSFRQLGERSLQETIEVTLRNQSEEAVTIQVIEHLYRAHDAEITDSSMDYTELDANTIQFDVAVRPEGTATVTYTVIYRW